VGSCVAPCALPLVTRSATGAEGEAVKISRAARAEAQGIFRKCVVKVAVVKVVKKDSKNPPWKMALCPWGGF
jgi:hypothetical protein